MPWPPFPKGLVPLKSVPMKFSSIRFPEEVLPWIPTPSPMLPEMRLPVPGAVPPIVLLEESIK